MGVRAKVPLSLSGVLFVAVAVLGGLQVWSGNGATGAIEATAVLAYLAWLVVETRLVSVREATLPDAPRDKGSCEAYAVAQGATVLLALMLASHTSPAVAADPETGEIVPLFSPRSDVYDSAGSTQKIFRR